MKQVIDKQLGTGIRLSLVLSLFFAVCLLWTNTCFAVSSSWDYYSTIIQEDGAVLKDNSVKSSQLCLFPTEEVEEKESEEKTSADHTDCNHCISRLGICPNLVLSLYDSALLSSPPLKRYLLFHALKLDC